MVPFGWLRLRSVIVAQGKNGKWLIVIRKSYFVIRKSQIVLRYS